MTKTKEEPRRGKPINRGDLYWIGPEPKPGSAPDPQEDPNPDPTYAHPHVVVQEDVLNHSRVRTVVVCALTTNLHRANEPGNLLLEEGEGNLPRRSVVVVSQIDSVEKTRLGEKIGTLKAERVDQILAGLRFQQSTYFGRER